MQSAKSLRKLRTATTAYLEDGGALIHSIDSLIRDVHRAIQDLDDRERVLDERERRLVERETKLELLNDRIEASLSKLLASTDDATSAPTLAAQPLDSEPAAENQTSLQSSVSPPDSQLEMETRSSGSTELPIDGGASGDLQGSDHLDSDQTEVEKMTDATYRPVNVRRNKKRRRPNR